MSTWQSWAVVIALAIGTFLIRYSFIGLLANREIPKWLERSLQLMVPAIFAAIVAMGLAMAGGQLAGWSNWPRYCAAAIAFIVARRLNGHIFYTVASGMLTLHALEWLRRVIA